MNDQKSYLLDGTPRYALVQSATNRRWTAIDQLTGSVIVRNTSKRIAYDAVQAIAKAAK